jgi:hypothetical protein
VRILFFVSRAARPRTRRLERRCGLRVHGFLLAFAIRPGRFSSGPALPCHHRSRTMRLSHAVGLTSLLVDAGKQQSGAAGVRMGVGCGSPCEPTPALDRQPGRRSFAFATEATTPGRLRQKRVIVPGLGEYCHLTWKAFWALEIHAMVDHLATPTARRCSAGRHLQCDPGAHGSDHLAQRAQETEHACRATPATHDIWCMRSRRPKGSAF